MQTKHKNLVLVPNNPIRANWEESFKQMANAGEDELLDPETSNKFDESWEW